MNPLEAALLGLLQGLTEFLPVSSSGHLVLGQALLGIHVPGVAFEVTVHVATLLAVLVVYRSRIVELVRGLLTGDRDSAAYVGLLVVASVPAAAVGLTARPFLEGTFERPSLAAGFLERPNLLGAVVVGLAQALAILPGISRSGSTVAVGAGTGVSVVRMAEFSFLLSVPAIAGAALLQAMGGEVAWGTVGGTALIVGFVVATVAGILAIRLFVQMLRSRHFHWYYCWLVGGAYLLAAAVSPGLR
jgi:undecaprenyl-diphosphatase